MAYTVKGYLGRWLERIDALKDVDAAVRFVSFEPLLENLGVVLLDGIQWAIVGGESGPNARPFDVLWARSIVEQCRKAGVPVFVKQLGADPRFSGRPLGYFEGYDLKDKKGGDPSEWPEDIRVRQFP